MITTFDILVKLAGVQTVEKAPSTPMGVNAPNTATPMTPVARPGMPSVPSLKSPSSPNPMKPASPVKPVPTGSKMTPQAKIAALDANSALWGLGAGLGGFAAGKAFVEPALEGAAKASPWLIGALAALVVGSIAANSARKDENQKVHLEHALASLSPAERQMLLEQGNQTDLRNIGFHSGPALHPSDQMAGRRFF